MTIAEQIVQAKEDYDAVYDAGKKAEYDAFWDAFQSNGEPSANLAYRFYKWKDAYYNPKYPFKVQGVNTVSRMFSYTDITDTKVDIDLSGSTTRSNKSAVFEYGRNLKIIRKVIVNELIPYGGWFVGCTALEEICFDGTIAADINFGDCKKLTLGSLIDTLRHLKDFTGTGEGYTRTLTLSQASVDILNEDTISWLGSILSIEKKWNLTIV
jgi:hypothetical protein